MRSAGLVFIAFATVVSAASPVLPGLHGKHPLDEKQVGHLLLTELRCRACHANGVRSVNPAPDLTQVGARVSPDYMRKFIASPAALQPGTTMPSLLDGEAERDEIAEAITHYLVVKADKPFRHDLVKPKDIALGQKLFHRIGCVGCHSPRDTNGRETRMKSVVGLAHVPAKYSLVSLSDFLFQPAHARPSGRMPDMNLTRDEARSIASYLIGIGIRKVKSLKPEPWLAARGQKYFQQFNCSACHEMEGVPSKPVLVLDRVDVSRGCLSENPKGTANFHLDKTQRTAIASALTGHKVALSDKAHVDLTLTAFNCIACHQRDNYGGVSNTILPFFLTDQEGLGNEARIPPPLTLVGAKLRTEWLQKLLFDAETVRPYMHTRMPQFGEGNLGHLPALLGRLDKLEPVAMPKPERDERRKFRESGHQLVGDKGLNCVACHNFNGKESPGLKGLDLLTSFERLKPSWFYHFMLDPTRFRPGIVMPNYWPGGQPPRTNILEGDTDAQLKALWFYFSLGRSARDPSGIRSAGTALKVTDTTRIYRGRSGIAGYRGIAVGFPGGLNFAFNAQTGALTGLWRGDFVNVGWGGQGAGNFNPAARPIPLAQDLAFYRLENDRAPWPLRPTMDKDNPINPDPRYPHNRGYQFKGYYLDTASVPVLMYRTGETAIEDASNSKVENGKPVLQRTLSFDTPEAKTLYFRALTGKVKAVSPTLFMTESLQISVPKTETLFRGNGDSRELLLKLNLPNGKSKVRIDYVPLR